MVSTARSWRAAAASASSNRSRSMPNFVGRTAAVLEMRRCSRHRSRVDADPDAAPGGAPAVSLDLADRVEVQMDAVREQHVEVALRYVRPGVADLVRSPAALERADRPRPASRHRCRRFPGVPGAPRPRNTRQHFRARVRLHREPQPERDPGPCERGLERPCVLGEPLEVVGEQRRPVLARERLGIAAGDRQAAVDHRCRGPAGPTTERRRSSPAESDRLQSGRRRRARSTCSDRPRRRRRGPRQVLADASAISAMAASKASRFFSLGSR